MAARVGLPPLVHGGDLGAARKLFKGAPEPILDLSTGINPNPYPVPALPADALTKLPEPEALAGLAALAAEAYGAPASDHVVVAPGSQVVMALAASLVTPGTAVVLAPTYAEHARAARIAGHDVSEVTAFDQLEGDLAIVVNPNNPNGRLVGRDALLALASRVQMLIVDEAFMDAGPAGHSLAGDTARGNVVVLRSFGKFFGLPGLRLSFALATPGIAAWLRAALGPWPVSGAALAIGAEALADKDWIETTRSTLATSAKRLDSMLSNAGLKVLGGTALFRLVETASAGSLFMQLGQAGILVRRFDERPEWLRFGLPGSEADWQRLEAALASASVSVRS